MKRKDVNEIAFDTVRQATGEIPKIERGKNHEAIELGRSGGLIGGAARSKTLTPERRAEIARKAAESRWKGNKEKKNRPT